jgi:UDP-N-acetylglucosamine--N-acetylmuramyl-(pentapeptide) pyrophosphoryl-undecaprenol N-acetylglucosamine transferase
LSVPALHVLLAGGGTAGHVEPALSTADALKELTATLGFDCEVTMLGTADGLEARLVPERGFDLELIPRVTLPRRPSIDFLTLGPRLRSCVKRTEDILTERSIDVVVGFGGYVSVPAYLAARKANIPVVVHEANVRPGYANKLGARITTHVATGLPGTKLPHARLTGMPLRSSISSLDRAALREQARAHFGLDDRPVVLAFGGSLGAARITGAILGAQGAFGQAGLQVLLVAGTRGIDQARAQADTAVISVVEYIDRMDLAYSVADLVVARSGAMTCAEVAAVGVPSILVPLPIGNGEQKWNAESLTAAGAAVVIADDEFNAAVVRQRVVPLMSDLSRLESMGRAAKSLGRNDADRVFAQFIVDVALPELARTSGGPSRDGQS